VDNGAGAVGVDFDENAFGVAGQCFVDGIIDDFVDEMMKAARIVTADIHAWACADVFNVVEDLDHPFVVCRRSWSGGWGGCRLGIGNWLTLLLAHEFSLNGNNPHPSRCPAAFFHWSGVTVPSRWLIIE